QVVFKTFAVLRTRPIHEEAILAVHLADGDHHIRHDSQGREAGEQADNQRKAAEELGTDGNKSQRRWNTHLEKRTGGEVEAEPPEPAQHFLRAMDEKGYSQHQSRDSKGQVVGGCEHSAKHEQFPSAVFNGHVLLELINRRRLPSKRLRCRSSPAKRKRE